MRKKLIHAVMSLAVFAGLSLVLVSLTWPTVLRSSVAAMPEEADDHGGHAEATAEPAHSGELAGHEHAETDEAISLAELVERQCEHGPIVDCDECRYEVGVARIDPALARDLVEARPVHMEQRANNRLEMTGEVQFDLTRVAEVAFAGSGRVQEIRKTLGDSVESSDVLAVIQSSEFGQAHSDFLQTFARRDLARQTHDREKQLHEKKISSQADYLAAANDLAAAEAAVAAARKRLQLFGLDNQQIDTLTTTGQDATFGQLALKAPIGGTVIQQNIVRGQLVSGSDTLFRIADLSHVWIWCDAYESDVAALYERFASKEPVQAEVTVRAFPGTVFGGTVDMIGNELDRETRTLKVRVLADNPGGKLKPGMFAKVSLGLDEPRSVLRVPETAVLSDEGQSFVFVQLRNDLWARRNVTIGPAEGDSVEVYEGLADGETVATRGAFMFKSEVLKEKMGAGCAH